MSDTSQRSVHVFFSGQVQGVGFRYTCRSLAGPGITGWVRNRSDGRVELNAEGTADELEQFLQRIRENMSGYIDGEELAWGPASAQFHTFYIEPTY